MKCFYHSADFDGKCSGAIVKLAFPQCELLGIDYGDTFPWDILHENEDVCMVDFTLQPYEDMLRLQKACALTWIDHHKTSLEWADKVGFRPRGLTSLDFSGCELTWRYLYSDKDMPEAVSLLGRYDIWKHENPKVLPFQFGMRYLDPSADDVAVWESLFNGKTSITEVVNKGLIVQKAQKQSHAAVCKMAGFDLVWEGLRWTVVNGPYRGSMVHKTRFHPDKHDASLGFYWNGKMFMFSLTTEKPDVDVSAIAKKYGGGGHRAAAGFQADVLPFALRSDVVYEDAGK